MQRRIAATLSSTLLVLAAGLASLVPGSAWAVHYDLDPPHTQINFQVKHMTITTVTGRFQDFTGGFDYDPATGHLTGATAVIKTASITTDIKKRDDHLRSGDFFAADSFPTITFTSTEVTPAGKDHFTMKGNLTMRGVTKPVTLDVEFGGALKDPWGNQRAAFTATGKINRMDYGVKWNSKLDNGGLVVSEDVKLMITAEGTQAKTQGS